MINCSVTVMPVYLDVGSVKIGFIRRSPTDTLPNKIVAPGGKIEESDGCLIDGVPYFSAEMAGIRELKEETGIEAEPTSLFFLCSLTLPSGRIVISFYIDVHELWSSLIWMDKQQIEGCNDFAPGMKEEALLLLDRI